MILVLLGKWLLVAVAVVCFLILVPFVELAREAVLHVRRRRRPEDPSTGFSLRVVNAHRIQAPRVGLAR